MGYQLQNQFNTPQYKQYIDSLKRPRGRPRALNKLVYVKTGRTENWILSVGGHGPIDDSGSYVRFAKLVSERQVARSTRIAGRMRGVESINNNATSAVRYKEEYDNG